MVATPMITPIVITNDASDKSHIILVHGKKLTLSLPADTTIVDTSRCNWMDDAKVATHTDSDVWGKWNRDHDMLNFGGVLYDGMSFNNTTTQSVTVSAHIWNGCK